MLDHRTAYISDQQYPIEKADSEQVVNTVSALAAEGMDIQLVIPRNWRNFGTPKQKRLQRLQDFYGLRNGLHPRELIHLPMSNLRLEKYTHGIIAPIWVKLLGYDIVYTRNPLPALVASWLGLKVVFETYRVYGRSQRLSTMLIRSLARSQNLLGIITHSSPSRKSLLQCGLDKDKVRVIHNGFNPELFKKSMSREEARRQLGLSGDTRIACYSGRLDREKGVGFLLELAARTPEITYLFIGKSQQDARGWIEQTAAKGGLQNIRVMPWLSQDKLVPYFYASDVLLIPPTAAPLVQHGKTVLPLKLFLYMAAGRPILAPGLPDSAAILNDSNAILVEPDNLEHAATRIRQVFSNPEWAESLARQAESDSQHYTWPGRAKQIIAFFLERLSAS